MKLDDLIKDSIELKKDDVVKILDDYSSFNDIQNELGKLKINRKRVLEIINLFVGEKNPKLLGFVSTLYSEIKNYTSASEYAFACFHGSDKLNKSPAFVLYFNSVKALFDEKLMKDDYENAKKELEKLEKFVEENKIFDDLAIFNNTIVALEARLKDSEVFNKKVKRAEENMEKQQWKFIEIIGLFSAVIAFIITNIQIVSSVNLSEISIIRIMFCMACVLIIFSISLSYLFSTKRSKDFWSFLNNAKFLALVVLILLLLAIINTL
ncbi:MAG TPA: hypothetical protein PLO44_00020 [Candidatus Paceibacterota bacterium]|nr:hypothetical protein [Candidatus Paceibacterota bacterium]